MGIRVRQGSVEAVAASPERFAIRVEQADDVTAAGDRLIDVKASPLAAP